jgi:hypothetical protein
MSGFQQAWTAYLCAMYGHVWSFTSNYTGASAPSGSQCSRCGGFKP